jgi:hypothetical protein
MRLITRLSPLALILAAAVYRSAADTPVPVRLVQSGSGWQLLRDGKPYQIHGAGGSASLAVLKAAGGNSVRTWDAKGIRERLDEAQKLGMTVTVGIWLGHERHGFDYNNAEMVARQAEDVRKAVLEFKDHPAVLLWGIGNEMEGEGSNAAIWSAINNLAVMVKRLDPNHPVMTVIAEVGGDKVKNLHRLCPDVDIVGLNSYAGASSLARRYHEAGGSKPYVLTEFGPPGTWEVAKTSWGAPVEPTSTEKAASYRKAWDEAVAKSPLSLGGYAFTWGWKQERTATWFGMLLSDGRKTGAVDAMTEAWTGTPAANPCPIIKSLKLLSPEKNPPGATARAVLEAENPSGGPLDVKWVVQPEADQVGAGGDAEAALPTLSGAVVRSNEREAEVKLPTDGGYRIFAYVRNGADGAAVANVPVYVDGPVKVRPAAQAKLPLVVVGDGASPPPFVPTGWMGNVKAIRMNESCKVLPHTGATCVRIDYTAAADWGGVVWQSPPNDWGDKPGGWNLTGARRLSFWARGEKGGEVVSFQLGLLGPDKRFRDTSAGSLPNVKLTREWQQYAVDLTGKDLSRIKTGFAWTVAAQGAPVTFYLDDIQYEP